MTAGIPKTHDHETNFDVSVLLKRQIDSHYTVGMYISQVFIVPDISWSPMTHAHDTLRVSSLFSLPL
ncbi:hypothetical protein E2C01_015234 [Portunus trituberculatus]|uniref:Uncharacterized protein n=1 Tax=Portunus trituberculatus TaxID=210409 RepID=A0A5B7DME1_PORTR|nr:hypothetical protein [Portunus trituberculatus]